MSPDNFLNKTKTKLAGYFGKRTPEQIQKDKEEQERKDLQKQVEEEAKYQGSLQKQPSRFEEDVSKVAKGTVKIIRKGVKVTVPLLQKAEKKAAPVLKKEARTLFNIGKRMARGAAKVEYEDKSQKTSSKPPSPQKQQRIQPERESVNKPKKPYNDDYFVSSKKPSQKPPKKGKGNTGRGFGLGF